MKSRPQSIMHALRYADCVLLAGVASVVWPPESVVSRVHFLLLLLLIPIHSSIIHYFGLYESHRVEGLRHLVRNLASAQIIGAVLLSLGPLLFGYVELGLEAGLYFAVSGAAILTERVLVYAGLKFARSRGFDVRNVCLIGTPAAAQAMQQRLVENPSWGMRIEYVGTAGGFQRYSTAAIVAPSLEDLLRLEPVDEVLISALPSQLDQHKNEVKLCQDYGVTARFILESERPPAEAWVEDFQGGIAVTVTGLHRKPVRLAVKRLLDLVAASAALAALTPLLVVIALLVKLSSKGPVFFLQRRVGRNGRHFTIYKFRTMIVDAEAMLPALASRNITQGPAFKSVDDWRVTQVGRWLRRFSLDELPQLFNVVKGDMSLVGPRPLPLHEALAVDGPFRRRFAMRPGITCFWQVSGRSDITFVHWMIMDLKYIDSWSLWLDTKLIVETIPAVITGRGAY